MADELQLNRPWLVAVWPGMGNVALNAGVYLLAKLGMTGFAEFEVTDLFDVEHVTVDGGIIQPPRRPRNRFFAWKNPASDGRDLVVFVGEAQPPLGKYPLCKQIVQYAKQLGVERVFTFAAMATGMMPGQESRVFAAATNEEELDELKQLELVVLNDGQIGGLNGILLAAAAEADLHGVCLLGEMPAAFTQVPFPKASLAILEVFADLADLDLDFSELSAQAHIVEERLAEVVDRVQDELVRQVEAEEEDESEVPEPEPEETGPTAAQRERIEQLFEAAMQDRSRAIELKHELDHLGLFKEYEDRFLDLFKKPQS